MTKEKKDFIEFSFRGLDEYLVMLIVFVIGFAAVILVVLFVQPVQIDTSGIATTNKSYFTIPVTAVFTMVNGIATIVSIIVGFGVTLSALVFREVTQDDAYLKHNYFESLAFFTLPIFYVFASYLFLTLGEFELAVRWSVSSFFFTMLFFLGFWLINGRRLKIMWKKKAAIKLQN
ncbi:MAG: hypothetical protein ACE14S_10095 [Candidatus Bathyarchaeia archaeon]